mgnify:CR=1 FL=1
MKNPFEGSISELEHEYQFRRRCAALANLERKRAVSNAVGAIALWLYLGAGAIALKVGGSSKAGNVANDKAKLLSNGDKWERAIAANLEADAPYR